MADGSPERSKTKEFGSTERQALRRMRRWSTGASRAPSYVIITIGLLVALASSLGLEDWVKSAFADRPLSQGLVAGLVFVGFGLLQLLGNFLQGDPRGTKELGGELRINIPRASTASASAPEVPEESSLAERYRKLVEREERRAEERYGTGDRARLRAHVDQHFDAPRQRLSSEILNLRRQAQTNLVLGIGTTGLAVGILAVLAFYTDVPLQPPYWPAALKGYVPRLALAVFIQVFAFFFLRLYRAGLADIKYYQNELTNVESAMVSLSAALAIEDSDAVDGILTRLSAVERNFVLKPGESTVELEHVRQENESLKALIGILDAAGTLRGNKKDAGSRR